MRIHRLLGSIGLIFMATAVLGQNTNRDRFIKDSLDVYINRALTNWRIPGVAVCIIKDGNIVLMKGYGIREIGLNDPITPTTLFMIGSNTKLFTATALAMLQSQHKLSLQDRVTKYLPDFKLDEKPAGELCTITDLLCHRIGFSTFQGDFTYWTSNLTRAQVTEKMSRIKADYPFRTRFGYTNAAFLTAGEIIPKVTGKPWEVYVKEQILAPLGMGSTLMLSKDLPFAINKAAPHTLVDGRLTAIPFCAIDNLAPAGSISSNINDLSKWLMLQLNNGNVGKRPVIPLAAIQATRQPQTMVKEIEPGNVEFYGLGLFIKYTDRHQVLFHTGATNGYFSSVTFVPDLNLGIIVLTNTDQNDFIQALPNEVLDAYLKKPFHNYSDELLAGFKKDLAAQQATNKRLADSAALNLPTALPMAAYTGTYTNDLYGRMTVDIGGDTPELQMHFEHHPKMFAHLQALGGNRFFVTFSDPAFGKAVFPFKVLNGRVTGVRVKVDDEIEYNAYDFVKAP